MEKILIVEDDIWILNSLKLYLENSDFQIDTNETWDWVSSKVLNNNYDLIVLDINLPIKDWITICREIREKSQIPIIMLTARNNESDKIELLNIWADDYISKPFSPRELLARIKSILRRINNWNTEESNTLKHKDISIDLDKLKVYKSEKEINLTKNEFDIFKKIVEENWKLVLRETLMTEIIWYEQYIYDRTIDTHIKNLRKKLEDKNIIITVRWEWYRLNN